MMPSMVDALFGFENTVGLTVVNKAVSDHDVVETSKVPVPLYFEAVLQPLHPRELLVKTEGERKFKWWKMYADIDLEVDTIVKDQDGNQFRVMASSNWAQQAGYQEYDLVEGPGLSA